MPNAQHQPHISHWLYFVFKYYIGFGIIFPFFLSLLLCVAVHVHFRGKMLWKSGLRKQMFSEWYKPALLQVVYCFVAVVCAAAECSLVDSTDDDHDFVHMNYCWCAISARTHTHTLPSRRESGIDFSLAICFNGPTSPSHISTMHIQCLMLHFVPYTHVHAQRNNSFNHANGK